jgi:hypothetical protein
MLHESPRLVRENPKSKFRGFFPYLFVMLSVARALSETPRIPGLRQALFLFPFPALWGRPFSLAPFVLSLPLPLDPFIPLRLPFVLFGRRVLQVGDVSTVPTGLEQATSRYSNLGSAHETENIVRQQI